MANYKIVLDMRDGRQYTTPPKPLEHQEKTLGIITTPGLRWMKFSDGYIVNLDQVLFIHLKKTQDPVREDESIIPLEQFDDQAIQDG